MVYVHPADLRGPSKLTVPRGEALGKDSLLALVSRWVS